MKQFYKHGEEYYLIHRDIAISHFADKDGVLNMDNVKLWRDYLNGVGSCFKNRVTFFICRNN